MDHLVDPKRIRSSCVGRSSFLKPSIKGIKRFFNFIWKYTKKICKKWNAIVRSVSEKYFPVSSQILLAPTELLRQTNTGNSHSKKFNQLALCSNKLYFEHEKLSHICWRCQILLSSEYLLTSVLTFGSELYIKCWEQPNMYQSIRIISQTYVCFCSACSHSTRPCHTLLSNSNGNLQVHSLYNRLGNTIYILSLHCSSSK